MILISYLCSSGMELSPCSSLNRFSFRFVYVFACLKSIRMFNIFASYWSSFSPKRYCSCCKIITQSAQRSRSFGSSVPHLCIVFHPFTCQFIAIYMIGFRVCMVSEFQLQQNCMHEVFYKCTSKMVYGFVVKLF